MLAHRVYHQFGSWGCFWTCIPVFAAVVHGGGVTASTFSFRCLASFWMKSGAGTSLGVVKIALFL